MELTIYFLLERNSVQASKYIMVTGVYPSHIDFKFKGHCGKTVEAKPRPNRSNGTIHRQVNPL